MAYHSIKRALASFPAVWRILDGFSMASSCLRVLGSPQLARLTHHCNEFLCVLFALIPIGKGTAIFACPTLSVNSNGLLMHKVALPSSLVFSLLASQSSSVPSYGQGNVMEARLMRNLANFSLILLANPNYHNFRQTSTDAERENREGKRLGTKIGIPTRCCIMRDPNRTHKEPQRIQPSDFWFLRLVTACNAH